MAPATTDYGNIQQDEIDVLRSIFMDDFLEEQEKTGAWNKRADRSFQICLRGLAGDEESIACTLTVSFPATYPRSVPNLKISFQDNVRAQTQTRALAIIAEKPSTLVGSEMIYELSILLQDVLHSQPVARDTPTLDEERATRELQAAMIKSQQEEAGRKRESAAREAAENAQEEERLLQELVEQEKIRSLRRKSDKASKNLLSNSAGVDSLVGTIFFDRPSQCRTPWGGNLELTAVHDKVIYRSGPISTTFTVQPGSELIDGAETDGAVRPPFLILKEYTIAPLGADDVLKDAVQNLEAELERQIHDRNVHQSVLRTANYLIARTIDAGWKVSILTELASKGSLLDIIDIVGQLDANKTRMWAIHILEGLHYYHRNNLIHGCLHLNNVLLEQGEAKNTIAQLSDGGYQRHLYALKRSSPYKIYPLAWHAPHLAPRRPANPLSRLSAPSPGPSQRGTVSPKAADDIWYFGICLLQMGLGTEIIHEYRSPAALLDDLQRQLSPSFLALLHKVFTTESNRRPSAWDLLHYEFFRNDDALIDPDGRAGVISIRDVTPALPKHRRNESTSAAPLSSRYAKDFVEDGRLGRGGFGEVFRARNRVDGQPYAVKKIKARSRGALDPVLSEASVLSRLSHPNVVRYYASWIEDSWVAETGIESMTSSALGLNSSMDQGGQSNIPAPSSKGLDFISSNNLDTHLDTEFDDAVIFGDVDQQDGHDPDKYDAVSSSNDSASSFNSSSDDVLVHSNRAADDSHNDIASSQPQSLTVLYIQMEYCKPETLRNVITMGIQTDPTQAYRLLRQILLGLAHIHASAIVHRDLKPENIFIDSNGDIRIGDFGLARPGDYNAVTQSQKDATFGDFTHDIGTASYVAPEVRSNNGSGKYNEKADMYSLGIIFLEMNVVFATAMERAEALDAVRKETAVMPDSLQVPEKATQLAIIRSLLQINPSLRPSSSELIDSGLIPLQEEDETYRMARRLVLDTDSHIRQDLLHSLFPTDELRQTGSSSSGPEPNVAHKLAILEDVSAMSRSLPEDLELQTIVKQRLTIIFRRHGAVERTDSPAMFPYNSCYSTSQVLQFLAPTGKVLQLPYDLILPNAMLLARTSKALQKRTFIFDNVYRVDGQQDRPSIFGEANFDIVSGSTDNLAVQDAETLKTLDEVLDAFPNLSSAQMCYHINHSVILDTILRSCEIDVRRWPALKETMSKLNTADWTWSRIRHELRAPPISIAGTCLDELERFNFRDTIDNSTKRLRSLLPQMTELEPIFIHLHRVTTYLAHFGVKRKIFLSPLSSYNEKFYRGNIIFQCLYDHKRKAVFAAGGRYDQLIRDHQPIATLKNRVHAVGFQLTWSGLSVGMMTYLKAHEKSRSKRKPRQMDALAWNCKRCDVLIDGFDHKILTSVGLEVLAEIWGNEISAELAVGKHNEAHDYVKPDEVQGIHGWIVMIKSDSIVRVKNNVRKEETELPRSDLLAHLRSEIRERDREESRAMTHSHRNIPLPRQASHMDPTGPVGSIAAAASSHSATAPTYPDPNSLDIKVLLSQTKGKKVNRKAVVEEALLRAQDWRAASRDYPIIAIETKEHLFHAIATRTTLHDADAWKRVIQDAPAGERAYLGQIQNLLLDCTHTQPGQGQAGPAAAFVYNFRTKQIMDYHLGK